MPNSKPSTLTSEPGCLATCASKAWRSMLETYYDEKNQKELPFFTANVEKALKDIDRAEDYIKNQPVDPVKLSILQTEIAKRHQYEQALARMKSQRRTPDPDFYPSPLF